MFAHCKIVRANKHLTLGAVSYMPYICCIVDVRSLKTTWLQHQVYRGFWRR